MTNGQLREVTVTKKRNSWSLLVDDKVAGSTAPSSDSAQEYLLPFTVGVPGVAGLEAFLTIEFASQTWNYMLCVNGTPVEPWWTMERGDTPNSQAPEVLGESAAQAPVFETPRSQQQSNAPRENLGNSLRNQQITNPSTTASGTDAFYDPGGQHPDPSRYYEEDLAQEAELLPDFRRPQRSSKGFLGCCSPEVSSPRPRGALRNVEPEPCCWAPSSLQNRPVARTCHYAQIQCGHWAWELFG